ncbi:MULTISPECIES: N-6 DNA methylase [Streptomyces]|uniref:N-6 DNA methylase n=1 Tax=Streptomyces TaxID=1883 RepID=UPI000A3CCA8C|nr:MULTISPECIES: N-6 DNA methylase [Streptomyces]RSS48689.1 restriction endonuclease subunit M [Streptomyces sp. WAC05858]
MTNDTSSTVSVTLAEIARLAGVGRAAVSNWRRRYETFPSPIGGTDVSPLFSLFEVEKWLQAESKIKRTVGSLDRLWPEIESLGDRDAMGWLIASVGMRLAPSGHAPLTPAKLTLSARQADLLEQAADLAESEGAARTFDFLLERWHRMHVRQITVTPAPLAELMAGIASTAHRGKVRSVLDPACGTGTLLLTVGRRPDAEPPALLGQDSEPVLAALASARLAMAGLSSSVAAADTLRADAHAGVHADLVLCNPPSNQRDWGHAELATDARWVYGQPPRTEPELAWVQHATAALTQGGVAVLVLPPAVAARRAGRRIRAGLLRSGALRAVIALPPGVAPPHGIGLHLWVLGTPDEAISKTDLLLVDTTRGAEGAATAKPEIDWARLSNSVTSALLGEPGTDRVSVPVVDLLDEQVDLTPGRHVPGPTVANVAELRRSWTRFDIHVQELRTAAQRLSALTPEGSASPSYTTVAELERAGALEIRSGQAVPQDRVLRGERPQNAVPVMTVAALLTDRPQNWLSTEHVTQGEANGTLTVTASQDVIVVGAARSFEVRVDTDAPSVLGPQLHALRTDPAVLDPWFLAVCLRAPANVRQAGTHASTSSRVDVRRLQVPRMPLEEQREYGEMHRKLTIFERELRGLQLVGSELSRSLTDVLGSGQLRKG